MRRYSFFAFFSLALIPLEGCNPSPPPPVVIAPPVSQTVVSPPTCGGGPAVPTGVMDENEKILAGLINNSRGVTALPPGPPDPICVGVAQFHAKEIGASGKLTLLGNDGEDIFRRIVCSGGLASTPTGVILIGVSSNPYAIYEVLQNDIGAFAVMYDPAFVNSTSVGYANGYWVIILQ